MAIFEEPPGKKWLRKNDRAFERYEWHSNREDAEERARKLRENPFNPIEETHVKEADEKFIIYEWG